MLQKSRLLLSAGCWCLSTCVPASWLDDRIALAAPCLQGQVTQTLFGCDWCFGWIQSRGGWCCYPWFAHIMRHITVSVWGETKKEVDDPCAVWGTMINEIVSGGVRLLCHLTTVWTILYRSSFLPLFVGVGSMWALLDAGKMHYFMLGKFDYFSIFCTFFFPQKCCWISAQFAFMWVD